MEKALQESSQKSKRKLSNNRKPKTNQKEAQRKAETFRSKTNKEASVFFLTESANTGALFLFILELNKENAMAITGQVSLARVGRSVQIFETTADLIDVFDPNTSPTLQEGDHITLYPGDFRDGLRDNPIQIPKDVYVTILPGALVGYDSLTGPLADRYSYISGQVSNIADLNIAQQYATQSGEQGTRVRIYPEQIQTAGATVPFIEVEDLDEAAETISNSQNSGQTVVVFPGFYEPTSNLYFDNTTWYFLEGATVRYVPDFNQDSTGEKTYPHALFDDLKDADGEDDPGGKDIEVYGNGEFQVGTADPQPVRDYSSNTELFDSTTQSAVDWKGWHLYSILAVNNSGSSAHFEAKKVQTEEYADGAFKLSATSDVNIQLEKGVVKSSIKQDTSLPSSLVPSFFVINGIPPSLDAGKIEIGVEDFFIEAGTSPDVRYGVALNHNPDPESTNGIPNDRNPYNGDLQFEAKKARKADAQTGSQFIRVTTAASPNKFVIQNTFVKENNPGVIFESPPVSADAPETKVIIKNSEISTKNVLGQPPLDFSGNPNGFDASIHNSWFLTGESVNFEAASVSTFSIENNTGNTDWTIKVYGDSFGDAPIQNFNQILHNELNNFSWADDVQSIS